MFKGRAVTIYNEEEEL